MPANLNNLKQDLDQNFPTTVSNPDKVTKKEMTSFAAQGGCIINRGWTLFLP